MSFARLHPSAGTGLIIILYNLLQLYKGKCPFDVPAMVNPGIYMSSFQVNMAWG